MNRHSLIVMTAATILAGCGTKPAQTDAGPATFTKADLAVFALLPQQVEVAGQTLSEPKIALGRALYYENLLSQSQDISCNSCHPLNAWGADGRKVSLGQAGTPGSRNAPTVYNAAGHMAQFWDGRAADVEAQAKGPILNPVEMAMPDTATVLSRLRGAPAYVASFRSAFPGERQPITYDNVGRAIGAFERRLMTPARWDKFLGGDSTALSPAERRGLRLFLNTGCQACHAGAFVGGDRFMKAGQAIAWFSQADSGRYQVTKDAKDLFVFKVPSLRNIEKTGPYFHDGSVASLDEAVRLMAHHQLGKELAPNQVQSIVTWLGALTGDLPTQYIGFPQRPQ